MDLNKLSVGLVSNYIYGLVLKNVVVPTVDFVVVRPDGKFLLLLRNEGAFAHTWFVGGGRQFRGETMNEALLRVLKREVGLQVSDIISTHFSHCQDVANPASVNAQGNPLPAWHSLWHFHVIKCAASFVPRVDSTSTAAQWFTFDHLPKDIPAPSRNALCVAHNQRLL